MAFLPFVRIKLKAAKLLGFVKNPQTLGEHLRRKRLQTNMRQREVAEILGACHTAYLRWETDQSEPYVRYYPAIIDFLGYVPWQPATSRQEQLLQFRRIRGWSIQQAACEAGVDEGTWGRWENADQSELPKTFPQPSWTRIEAAISDQVAQPGQSTSPTLPNRDESRSHI